MVYLIRLPQQGVSNKYPQQMFQMRNKKKLFGHSSLWRLLYWAGVNICILLSSLTLLTVSICTSGFSSCYVHLFCTESLYFLFQLWFRGSSFDICLWQPRPIYKQVLGWPWFTFWLFLSLQAYWDIILLSNCFLSLCYQICCCQQVQILHIQKSQWMFRKHVSKWWVSVKVISDIQHITSWCQWICCGHRRRRVHLCTCIVSVNPENIQNLSTYYLFCLWFEIYCLSRWFNLLESEQT